MSFRISVISKVDMMEQKFSVISKIREFVNSNVSTGEFTPVITAHQPKLLQYFELGWENLPSSGKLSIPFVNVEGNLNPENDQFYTGTMGILTHPIYKDAVQNRRCIVIADAILVWNRIHAFLVFPKNKNRPFVMGGIWNQIKDPMTGRLKKTVSILTTVANGLFQDLGQNRAPLILNNFKLRVWMNSRHLSDVIHCMKPFDDKQFDAYPVDTAIVDPANKSLGFLQPIGPRIFTGNGRIPPKLESYASKMRRNKKKI